MFKKREQDLEIEKTDIFENRHENKPVEVVSKEKTNAIVKGSKLTGDILISYDLELDGDVEGNITSHQQSNIIIKGTCKGTIKTKGGNVDIEGQMNSGDVIAGGNVKITGKFHGGKIEANGKIYINGEFTGKLEGSEIEIGPAAQGKGELLYKENISIAKGAKVEVHICHMQEKQKETKKITDAKIINLDLPVHEMKEA